MALFEGVAFRLADPRRTTEARKISPESSRASISVLRGNHGASACCVGVGREKQCSGGDPIMTRVSLCCARPAPRLVTEAGVRTANVPGFLACNSSRASSPFRCDSHAASVHVCIIRVGLCSPFSTCVTPRNSSHPHPDPCTVGTRRFLLAACSCLLLFVAV